MHVICGLILYGKLAGITVGYTITSATSLAAINKVICVHNKGPEADCRSSYNPYMIGHGAQTSITGTKIGPELSAADKVWRVCSSMGNIALASTYATVVYDIMVMGQPFFRVVEMGANIKWPNSNFINKDYMVLSLLGAIGFGPLVVFFPIQMHIAQRRIKVLSLKWCALQSLNCLCMLVSLAAVVASVHEISQNIHKYKIFAYRQ
ncbi:hypothetical protein TSUD_10850 [Trifolium subterraneum]|nr:hypothetical protein TSUD_10850 [Trifolium subterraneum]